MILALMPIMAMFFSMSISLRNSRQASYLMNLRVRSLSYLAKLKFQRVR